MRALIVTGRLVQDQELVYPYYRLLEAGFEVCIAAEKQGEFLGIQGVKFRADVIFQALPSEYWDLVVIPGGVKCMEHLRLNAFLVRNLATYHCNGGVIASICSGAQMLISAGLCKGRTISGYPAIRVDIENAGGTFHEGPAVAFDRIVTAPHYRHLGDWMKLTFSVLQYEQERLNDHA